MRMARTLKLEDTPLRISFFVKLHTRYMGKWTDKIIEMHLYIDL